MTPDEKNKIEARIVAIENAIEPWAIRGKYSDSTPDEDVLCNPGHYDVWFWSQCHDENGKAKFNLDFLGKWRRTPTVPAESSTHPRRAWALRAQLEKE